MKVKKTFTFDTKEEMVTTIETLQKTGVRCVDGYNWVANGIAQMWDNFGRFQLFVGDIVVDDETLSVWEFDYNAKRV
jgi:hypothetical protein